MKLELVTPTGSILDTEVVEVIVPASDGLMGVLEGHADLLAALGDGRMTYKADASSSAEIDLAGGGFLQVDNNKVYVLAEKAVPVK